MVVGTAATFFAVTARVVAAGAVTAVAVADSVAVVAVRDVVAVGVAAC